MTNPYEISDDTPVYVISVADRKIIRQFKTAAGAAPDPVMELTRR